MCHLQQGEAEIDLVLNEVLDHGVTEAELNKVKNQAESTLEFGEVEVMNRAMNLAFASLSGDPNLVNREAEIIQSVSREDIIRVAREMINEDNASVMYYKKK